MKAFLQGALLRLYGAVERSGFLNTDFGRSLFEHAYEFYKAGFEAGAIDHLRAFVPPGSTVIDIGANVGFFTRRFAHWTGPSGRVIALEPEAANVHRLTQRLAREGFAQVEIVQVAATDETGTVHLAINPDHPGDHKLGTVGIDVPATRLDDLLAARGWPKVSLIKVDVQGAEGRVLAGAVQTLRDLRATWFVEIDDPKLRAMGSSAVAVLEMFAMHGYTAHRLGRAGIGPALALEEILRVLPSGSYEDLLFTPKA